MSTFFNPNALGGFLAVVLPVAVTLALTSRTRGAKPVFSALSVVIFLALLSTGSKGAFLGVLVAAVVCAVLLARLSRHPQRNTRALLAGMLLLALLVVAACTVSHGARAKLGGALGTGAASNMFRILTWKGTWHMALHYPWLGIGPGAFESVFGKFTIAGFTRAAHEAYLETAAEQGFFGIGVLLWLFGAVLFTGWRTW